RARSPSPEKSPAPSAASNGAARASDLSSRKLLTRSENKRTRQLIQRLEEADSRSCSSDGAAAEAAGGTSAGSAGSDRDSGNGDQDDFNGQKAAADDVTVTEQAHAIIVPSYATWFDYNSIHALERRSLPEFFLEGRPTKTPEAYLACRNFMIDTYRLNPQEYLTFTACRRNLHGDVCGILRVHAFLEQWGLINYQVDKESKLAALGPPSASNFRALSDSPACLAPLKPAPPSGASEKVNGAAHPSDKDSSKDAASDIQKSEASSKQPDKPPASRKSDWTDQETLSLLEGLELFKDDWNRVAEHVGSRTQEECVLHFLKLPIEDPFLEGAEEALGPLIHQPIPFSKAGNPIMCTVAFLAATVDPRIASAATKAALDEYAKMRDEIPNCVLKSHQQSVGDKEAADPAKSPKEAADPAKSPKDSADPTKSPKEAADPAKSPKEAADPAKSPKDSADPTKSPKEAADPAKSPKDSADPTKSPKEAADPAKNLKAAADPAKSPKAAADPAKSPREAADEEAKKAEPASALAAAAASAKQLAQAEESRIKSLVGSLVEAQAKKIEAKLRHFHELESLMDREREHLESQRRLLLEERQEFYQEVNQFAMSAAGASQRECSG
ncbi:hypothetical protein BOX15_Mlig033952g17, partial [Macrostomum lignano]